MKRRVSDRSPDGDSGHDSAGKATGKEGQCCTTGQSHHFVESADLVPGPGDQRSLGAIFRAEIGTAIPKPGDLLIGRAFPLSIASRDRERNDGALEMIDLFGQLATLATIVARLARQTFRCRNRSSERHRQYETDENAEMDAEPAEAKLHTRTIGRGILEL